METITILLRAVIGIVYSGKPTLRILFGSYGDKKIFKSKTQSIYQISTEPELIKKCAQELSRRLSHELDKNERERERKIIAASIEAMYKENKKLFDFFGLSYYSLTLGSDNKIYGGIRFGGSVEDWKALAEFIKSRKTNEK